MASTSTLIENNHMHRVNELAAKNSLALCHKLNLNGGRRGLIGVSPRKSGEIGANRGKISLSTRMIAQLKTETQNEQT